MKNTPSARIVASNELRWRKLCTKVRDRAPRTRKEGTYKGKILKKGDLSKVKKALKHVAYFCLRSIPNLYSSHTPDDRQLLPFWFTLLQKQIHLRSEPILHTLLFFSVFLSIPSMSRDHGNSYQPGREGKLSACKSGPSSFLAELLQRSLSLFHFPS